MRDLVKRLYKKFGSTDPFRVAYELGIKVITVPLNDIRGYYHCFRRNHFIYLSDNLTDTERTFICAHELGHYFLHRKINAVFMDRYTFCPKNKFEYEANAFAISLLMHGIDITEYEGVCTDQLLISLGIPENIVNQLC